MDSYQILRKIWKKLGFKGRIINYSSKLLWIVQGEEGIATAYILPPRTRSPQNVDVDGFRRLDGKPIEGHKSWWKVYDASTIEIFDDGEGIRTSKVKRKPVTDEEFTKKGIKYNKSENWAVPIKFIDDVQRNKKKRTTKYHVTNVGWVKPDVALSMTCNGEIANARPVFPSTGKPYIRTKRDREVFNNLEVKG
ncbi:MAG: DUF3892 domain-containing protein [Bdellovibrionota bacterium]